MVLVNHLAGDSDARSKLTEYNEAKVYFLVCSSICTHSVWSNKDIADLRYFKVQHATLIKDTNKAYL